MYYHVQFNVAKSLNDSRNEEKLIVLYNPIEYQCDKLTTFERSLKILNSLSGIWVSFFTISLTLCDKKC